MGIPQTTNLLAEIRTGFHDAILTEILRTVRDRQSALTMKRVVEEQLQVGDRIRLRDNIRPKYLIGMYGEITKLNGKTAILHIDDVRARRFAHGPVRCPYRFIEKVNADLIK